MSPTGAVSGNHDVPGRPTSRHHIPHRVEKSCLLCGLAVDDV